LTEKDEAGVTTQMQASQGWVKSNQRVMTEWLYLFICFRMNPKHHIRKWKRQQESSIFLKSASDKTWRRRALD